METHSSQLFGNSEEFDHFGDANKKVRPALVAWATGMLDLGRYDAPGVMAETVERLLAALPDHQGPDSQTSNEQSS